MVNRTTVFLLSFVLGLYPAAAVSFTGTNGYQKGVTPTLSGRFGQSLSYDSTVYRDVCISRNGKTAVFLLKSCATCLEQSSSPMAVAYKGGDTIRIGKYDFDVIKANSSLFHPSMGDFGSSENGIDVPRPGTCKG